MSAFRHLHVHSDYSLLDGACRHDGLIALAEEHDMDAVACTDHGNLFGAMGFYVKAEKAGIKLVYATLVAASQNWRGITMSPEITQAIVQLWEEVHPDSRLKTWAVKAA